MKKEEKAALAFGATALLLTKLHKSKTPSPRLDREVAPISQTADHVQGTLSVNSSGWDDGTGSYGSGFVVGALSVGLAWYTWNKYRPAIRKFATPPSA